MIVLPYLADLKKTEMIKFKITESFWQQMNILCLPSEKGEYCIFAKLNKVNFEKIKSL